MVGMADITSEELDSAVDLLSQYVLDELPAGFSILLDLNVKETMLSLVDSAGVVVDGCEPGRYADIVALCRRAQTVVADKGW